MLPPVKCCLVLVVIEKRNIEKVCALNKYSNTSMTQHIHGSFIFTFTTGMVLAIHIMVLALNVRLQKYISKLCDLSLRNR